MMKLIEQFKNLTEESQFFDTGDYLYFSTTEGLVKWDYEKTINLTKEKVYWFIIFNNKIIYQIENGGKFFEFENQKKINGNYYLASSLSVNNLMILIRGKNCNGNKVIYKYSKDGIEESNLKILPNLILDANKYLLKILNGLFVNNFNNEQLWQHSFSGLLEAEQGDDFIFQNGNIFVHNDKLYFSLFENNRHLNKATICIDINTGNLDKIYRGFAGNLTLFNNKIGIAGDKEVEILDLDTQNIIKKDYSKHLSPDKLSISWNSFKIMENELFYFIASDHRQGSYIGIIDLKMDKLIWLHAMNPDKETYDIGALDFKVSKNRMYVHCSDNSLYVFEKE